MISKPLWTVRILTLFPEMFPGPLALSLAGKALKEGIWLLETIDIRRFAHDRNHRVDDLSFGGDSGMVIRADILDEALIESIGRSENVRVVYLSPRGHRIDQAVIHDLASTETLILLCGRYEGIDERVIEAHHLEEFSLGDFVLSGGEIAAMAVIDACLRLVPGVVKNRDRLNDESFTDGLLEYPHYTRPAMWIDHQGICRTVPDVLLSGHHEYIRSWRQQQAERITYERRPDLWNAYVTSHEPHYSPAPHEEEDPQSPKTE